ncbi:MAG: hypothetical protein ACT4PM_06500 [Gemmatimonadales bacterium]
MRRLPILRLVLLSALILAGIGLFLALSPRAAPLVVPAAADAGP